MEMKDFLSGGLAVILVDIETVGPGRLLYGARHLLHGAHDMGENFRIRVEQVLGPDFWHDKRMAGIGWHDIEKGVDVVVLVDFLAWDLAGNDFLKDFCVLHI